MSWLRNQRSIANFAGFAAESSCPHTLKGNHIHHCTQFDALATSSCEHIFPKMTQGVPGDSEIPVPDKALRDLAKNVAKALPNFEEEEAAAGVK
jgi:hypothetical protein